MSADNKRRIDAVRERPYVVDVVDVALLLSDVCTYVPVSFPRAPGGERVRGQWRAWSARDRFAREHAVSRDIVIATKKTYAGR